MTAGKDPQFWKRFSYAVHLDEEQELASGGNAEMKESYVSM